MGGVIELTGFNCFEISWQPGLNRTQACNWVNWNGVKRPKSKLTDQSSIDFR